MCCSGARVLRVRRIGALDHAKFERPRGSIEPPCLLRHRLQHRLGCRAGFLQRFRRRHLGHWRLVLDTGLRYLERRRHVEDLLAVLDRRDAPAGETGTVATAVDEVDDRRVEIPASQEIRVQRMRDAIRLHGAVGGPQALPQYLTAEHLRAADVAAHAAKQVDLEAFQLQQPQQLGKTCVHQAVAHAQALLHRRTGGGVLQELFLGRVQVMLDRERSQRRLVERRQDQFLLARVGIDVADGEHARDVRSGISPCPP